ncbi:monovalent cation/H(+) antiporter subunit G [Aliikangiella marina]|uniref:Monovalent cation/H(+) antiporter subunit G n=1 Tax=Aliikangiella marina TaxID=1712262 RepID=A0A545TCL9_9GAMM|nr:monovalent cation/H(+) antiporter subunit G [Aliikangiella marina]TQV74926.1 monovalent cation/H(+) antiporter subunit G [Aliikangiella marina]
MLEQVLYVLSWIMLTVGGFFVLVGGIGALRLPNFYTRMHAASVTDTIATFLVLGGLLLQAGLTIATVKLIAILVFLLLTGPTASYALANAALLSGVKSNATFRKVNGKGSKSGAGQETSVNQETDASQETSASQENNEEQSK